MTSYTPSAVITAVDIPSTGFYQARTTFGTSVSGVRLKGIDKKFAVGQRVAIYQVDSEFGFSEAGDYIGQLAIPGALLPTIAKEAPASVALAYIATLAGNFRKYYKTGIISEVVSETKVRVDNWLLNSAVSGFSAGDRCLIQIFPGNPSKVLGWWQSVPKTPAGVVVFALSTGRIPFTAQADIRIIKYTVDEGSLDTTAQIVCYPNNPAATTAYVRTRPTTDSEDYLYSIYQEAQPGIILATRYLKWHKTSLMFTELSAEQWQAEAPAEGLYSVTANLKYWWQNGMYCQIGDFAGVAGENAFFTGDISNSQDQFFPLKGVSYSPLEATP